MVHRDEQQIVDVDFARPDSPPQFRARLHLAVFVLFDEALDRLSHVLREFGLGDRTRGAPEITRGYLPAPWLVSLPRETNRNRGPAALEELLIAVGQAHELARDGVTQGDARLRAIWGAHKKENGLLKGHLVYVAALVAGGVRAVPRLRNHWTLCRGGAKDGCGVACLLLDRERYAHHVWGEACMCAVRGPS